MTTTAWHVPPEDDDVEQTEVDLDTDAGPVQVRGFRERTGENERWEINTPAGGIPLVDGRRLLRHLDAILSETAAVL